MRLTHYLSGRLAGLLVLLGLALPLAAEITLPTPTMRSNPPGMTPPPAGGGDASPRTNAVPPKTAPGVAGLQITADLVDGSRILGRSTLTNLAVKSGFGAITIDLGRVSSVQMGTNLESVLQFSNGDKVSGTLQVNSLSLNTVFGPVALPLAAIRRFSVSHPGQAHAGLILHYTFDDLEAAVVRDHSGRGHEGKLAGPNLSPGGRKGGGCLFTQNLDELQVGNAEDLQLQEVTLSIWCKRARRDTPSSGMWSAVLFSYLEQGYGMGLQMDGTLFLAGDQSQFPARVKIVDTHWHHVALTRNGPQAVIYLDGEVGGEFTLNEPYKNFNGLTIGAVGRSLGYPFHGTLDEVKIFNRALGAAEIQQLFQEPGPIPDPRPER